MAMGSGHLPAADVIDLARGNRHLPTADVIDLARGWTSACGRCDRFGEGELTPAVAGVDGMRGDYSLQRRGATRPRA